MSADHVPLRGGYAALDSDHDALNGRGWHFFTDEGEYVQTLPYAAWTPAQLQRAYDALVEQWDSGYDARAMTEAA